MLNCSTSTLWSLVSSYDDYKTIITAHDLGFHFTNVGYYIADNGDWLPDPMRGQPAPLSNPQLDILYALFLEDAYTEDGGVDLDFIYHLFVRIYSHEDIRDAIHWMEMSGAIHRCDTKQKWGGNYSLAEIIRQTELFHNRIVSLTIESDWDEPTWIMEAIVKPVAMSSTNRRTSA